ncbi:LuxR family transcriptional regulator [Mycobacterium sp. E2327]|uniref:LuxR C-terminal-related transcriptional regulator n=1 Tax=Mycobacterium sp. E2327 TaxID=1834132 RepID=UPI0007FEBAAD|nr:LuxR family transcriptional regulator [Mycobacterium sp. E2327]OBI13936.1 LuxR family transcriptional regulator [Mycobacterium sp. E2327]
MTGGKSGSTEARAVDDFLSSASGGPSALVIEGDAGIGKTTLWLSALHTARERGFAVLAARAAATESVLAYASLADLMAHAGTDWRQLPDPQRLALDRILLRASTDAEPTDQRTVAAAVLSVVQILAEKSPVLLAIDDLQWLDPSSALAIGFVARRLTERVGMLATFRTNSHRDRAPSWFAPAPPAQLTRTRLGPLSIGALHAAVTQRLGRSLSRPQISRVYEVSAGNPFYAIELARTVLDQPPGARVSMPATLMELVRNRVGMLEPAVREVLLTVSCLGAPSIQDIAHATGRDADDVVALLDAAEVQGTVEIAGNRVQFTHPLLAQGCYDDATAAQRRAMHRRLATLVTEPELRARHLALSAPTADPATLQALDAAARSARVHGAPMAAAEMLELAIGLGADSPKHRIRLARNYLDAGDPARARALLEDVIRALPPGTQRAEALSMHAVVALYGESFLEAAELLERALSEVGDQLPLRVQILVSLSFAMLNTGDSAAALRIVDDAVTNAERLGHPQLLGQALSLRAHLRFRHGEGIDEAGLQRALELEDNAFMPAALRPSMQKALLLGWSGQLDTAYAAMVGLRQACIERGEENELIHLAFNLFQIEMWRGNIGNASLLAEDAAARAVLLGTDLAQGVALTMRATLAAHAGREAEARADVEEALSASRRCGAHILALWPLTTLVFLEVSLGNYAAAVRTAEPMLSQVNWDRQTTELVQAPFLPDVLEALIALGRYDEAEPPIDALERNGHRMDRAWMLSVGARCRAILLAAGGDVIAATAAAEAAMVEHDRLPMPFERARTQLLLGQLQRRRRHRDDATVNVSAALAVFDELDTPLWAARARAALARSEVDTGPAKLLTAGERRVAELAASGMTNREVAAALFISPKTVEVHLTRVYRKLDVRTRAGLARRIDQLKT